MSVRHWTSSKASSTPSSGFFRPWVSPSAYGGRAAAVSLLLWGPLYAAAALALVRLWRRDRAAAAAVVVVVLSAASAHAVTFVSLRHRSPFVDTAAICLAAPVLPHWARECRRRLRELRSPGGPRAPTDGASGRPEHEA